MGPQAASQAPLLEPTLFRTRPSSDFLSEFRTICVECDGAVTRLTNARYAEFEPQVEELLADHGLVPVRVTREGESVPGERAGMIATAGVLHAIGEGLIPAGDTVLIAITGGLLEGARGSFEPDDAVSGTSDGNIDERQLAELAESVETQ